MIQRDKWLNFNHGRVSTLVRFYLICGEMVNENITIKICSEDEHAKKEVKEISIV